MDITGKQSRNIYISNMPLEEALKRYEDRLQIQPASESVPIGYTLARTTAEAVFARISSPHYPCAAMDGIAVRAQDTAGASEKTPKYLQEALDFVYINTGNPMPQAYDSVIMIEDVVQIIDETATDGMPMAHQVQILATAYPWQHVRPVGEDIVQGEMIIPSRHKIRPVDIGAMICGGIETVLVYKKPKVGILPTGTEIVQSFSQLEYGKIMDSNSRVFEALVKEMNGIAQIYPPSVDDWDMLKEAILKGVRENDMLIINAGSSAGSKDFTVDLIRELGTVVVHGIALKPGKPTILGMIEGKAVIGIPGYPVSAYFAFETFVRPLLEICSRWHKSELQMEAVLTQRVVSSLKHQELVRVTLGEVRGKMIATPLNRGAGATMSLVKADGILSIDRQTEGIEAGQSMPIRLLKTQEEIKSRLVVIGSHDPILDLIMDCMPLTSGHVGSMGGILAMKRGECHLAPIHLIHEATGIYNEAYVRKYFPDNSVVLIRGVKRLQGLMVPKGNPKGIRGFEDLSCHDNDYVNRQKGSGTRQLLDYELKKRQIDPSGILGYQREMTTHMAVAVTVKSEGADAGLGVYACAKAMALDFIPVGYESYDFLLDRSYLEDERVKQFIEILQSESFAKQLESLGGYELENPGEIWEVDRVD